MVHLTLLAAQGHCNDFISKLLLLQPNCLLHMVYRQATLGSSRAAGQYQNGNAYLDSYLTKWVEAEFNIGQIYPTLQGCSTC